METTILIRFLSLAIYTIVIAVCFYYKGYNKAVEEMKEIDCLLARIMSPEKGEKQNGGRKTT